MTEDEAFTRAIVDSPGDDTPRLVYADWLDDRDDPRGPYLRAEHEWAKPWLGGKRPADSPELREMAAGLDQLWVARVSRPPVGVCCDHIELSDRGQVLTEAEIVAFEKRCQVGLPVEYRAFLLNYNGGCPSLNWMGHATEERLPVALSRFYSITNSRQPKPRTSLEQEISHFRQRINPQSLERFRDLSAADLQTYRNSIPIASCDDVIFIFIIATNESPCPGTLEFIDWTTEILPIGARGAIPPIPLLLAQLTALDR